MQNTLKEKGMFAKVLSLLVFVGFGAFAVYLAYNAKKVDAVMRKYAEEVNEFMKGVRDEIKDYVDEIKNK